MYEVHLQVSSMIIQKFLFEYKLSQFTSHFSLLGETLYFILVC
jgi:hypothetical protein